MHTSYKRRSAVTIMVVELRDCFNHAKLKVNRAKVFSEKMCFAMNFVCSSRFATKMNQSKIPIEDEAETGTRGRSGAQRSEVPSDLTFCDATYSFFVVCDRPTQISPPLCI